MLLIFDFPKILIKVKVNTTGVNQVSDHFQQDFFVLICCIQESKLENSIDKEDRVITNLRTLAFSSISFFDVYIEDVTLTEEIMILPSFHLSLQHRRPCSGTKDMRHS